MSSVIEQNSFRRGIMSLVLLSLLRQGDMYGYQLVQETKKLSGGRILTQEGSLYPVLYKLLEKGCITDYKVLSGKRMTRVYYHLEPAGVEYLHTLMAEYDVISTGLRMLMDATEPKES